MVKADLAQGCAGCQGRPEGPAAGRKGYARLAHDRAAQANSAWDRSCATALGDSCYLGMSRSEIAARPCWRAKGGPALCHRHVETCRCHAAVPGSHRR